MVADFKFFRSIYFYSLIYLNLYLYSPVILVGPYLFKQYFYSKNFEGLESKSTDVVFFILIILKYLELLKK